MVSRAIERAGVRAPFRGTHVLRHSFATRLLREGAMLFVRTDGTPINERRLTGFAFRLRSKPPRRVAEPASSASRW